jgi:hypothetical protein
MNEAAADRGDLTRGRDDSHTLRAPRKQGFVTFPE